MFEVRILSKEDITKIIKLDSVFKAVENVYQAKSNDATVVWPTVFYDFEKGKADMDIKSGYLKDDQLFGHKTVTWFGENEKKGLPTLIGMITVFDATTGSPLGIMDAAYITGIRTGVSSALGAKTFARKDSKKLLVVGAGNQAIFQIAATLNVFPNLSKVQVAASSYEEASVFVDDLANNLMKQFGISTNNIELVAVNNLEKATNESDIIITVTSSKEAIIKKKWLKEGTHISCVGADMEQKQELESSIMAGAKIFVDDLEHCLEVGEIEIPIKEGIISKDDIIGEIGDVLNDNIIGRESADEITIYDTTGMALMDIATAKIALDLASIANLGVIAKI